MRGIATTSIVELSGARPAESATAIKSGAGLGAGVVWAFGEAAGESASKGRAL